MFELRNISNLCAFTQLTIQGESWHHLFLLNTDLNHRNLDFFPHIVQPYHWRSPSMFPNTRFFIPLEDVTALTAIIRFPVLLKDSRHRPFGPLDPLSHLSHGCPHVCFNSCTSCSWSSFRAQLESLRLCVSLGFSAGVYRSSCSAAAKNNPNVSLSNPS